MIRRPRGGGSHPLKERIAALRPDLYRLAWSWCHDHAWADDLVQQTLLRALEQRRQLKEADKCAVWAVRIMANLFRDALRARRRDALNDSGPLDDVPQPAAAEPERACQLAYDVLQVLRAIERLNEEQRMTLTMVDVMGYSYAETAEALGVPIGTVMSRLSRARARLALLLDRQASPARTSARPLLRRVK